MSTSLWIAASDEFTLETTPASSTLGESSVVPGSTAMPPRAFLYQLTIQLNGITGGAGVEVTAWLTYDASGTEGITPRETSSATQVVTYDLIDSTAGFVTWRIEAPFYGSQCYCHALLSAGEANAIAKVYTGSAP